MQHLCYTCWSPENRRYVRFVWDGLLEEALIEDECPRCRRHFWRQTVVGTWSPWVLGDLYCPTCRKSEEEPEAEADPKWQRTRQPGSGKQGVATVSPWICRAWWTTRLCNTQNWAWRTRCRTCNSGQDAEPQDPKRQNTRQSWICRAWWPTHQTARVCNTQNWPWRTRCRTCNSGQDAEHGVPRHLSLLAELQNEECNH